jgi:hypothetical protein
MVVHDIYTPRFVDACSRIMEGYGINMTSDMTEAVARSTLGLQGEGAEEEEEKDDDDEGAFEDSGSELEGSNGPGAEFGDGDGEGEDQEDGDLTGLVVGGSYDWEDDAFQSPVKTRPRSSPQTPTPATASPPSFDKFRAEVSALTPRQLLTPHTAARTYDLFGGGLSTTDFRRRAVDVKAKEAYEVACMAASPPDCGPSVALEADPGYLASLKGLARLRVGEDMEAEAEGGTEECKQTGEPRWQLGDVMDVGAGDDAPWLTYEQACRELGLERGHTLLLRDRVFRADVAVFRFDIISTKDDGSPNGTEVCSLEALAKKRGLTRAQLKANALPVGLMQRGGGYKFALIEGKLDDALGRLREAMVEPGRGQHFHSMCEAFPADRPVRLCADLEAYYADVERGPKLGDSMLIDVVTKINGELNTLLKHAPGDIGPLQAQKRPLQQDGGLRQYAEVAISNASRVTMENGERCWKASYHLYWQRVYVESVGVLKQLMAHLAGLVGNKTAKPGKTEAKSPIDISIYRAGGWMRLSGEGKWGDLANKGRTRLQPVNCVGDPSAHMMGLPPREGDAVITMEHAKKHWRSFGKKQKGAAATVAPMVVGGVDDNEALIRRASELLPVRTDPEEWRVRVRGDWVELDLHTRCAVDLSYRHKEHYKSGLHLFLGPELRLVRSCIQSHGTKPLVRTPVDPPGEYRAWLLLRQECFVRWGRVDKCRLPALDEKMVELVLGVEGPLYFAALERVKFHGVLLCSDANHYWLITLKAAVLVVFEDTEGEPRALDASIHGRLLHILFPKEFLAKCLPDPKATTVEKIMCSFLSKYLRHARELGIFGKRVQGKDVSFFVPSTHHQRLFEPSPLGLNDFVCHIMLNEGGALIASAWDSTPARGSLESLVVKYEELMPTIELTPGIAYKDVFWPAPLGKMRNPVRYDDLPQTILPQARAYDMEWSDKFVENLDNAPLWRKVFADQFPPARDEETGKDVWSIQAQVAMALLARTWLHYHQKKARCADGFQAAGSFQGESRTGKSNILLSLEHFIATENCVNLARGRPDKSLGALQEWLGKHAGIAPDAKSDKKTGVWNVLEADLFKSFVHGNDTLKADKLYDGRSELLDNFMIMMATNGTHLWVELQAVHWEDLWGILRGILVVVFKRSVPVEEQMPEDHMVAELDRQMPMAIPFFCKMYHDLREQYVNPRLEIPFLRRDLIERMLRFHIYSDISLDIALEDGASFTGRDLESHLRQRIQDTGRRKLALEAPFKDHDHKYFIEWAWLQAQKLRDELSCVEAQLELLNEPRELSPEKAQLLTELRAELEAVQASMAQDKADTREDAGVARVIVYEGSRTLLGQEVRIKEQIAEVEKELVPADVGTLMAKCEELRAKVELAGAVRFIRTREDSGKMHYKCRTCWEAKPRKLRLEEAGECSMGHKLEGKKKLVLDGNCIVNIRLQAAEEYILADSQDD